MKDVIKYGIAIIIICAIISCEANKKIHGSDPHNYMIAYNVLTDEENDNYDVFTMDFDGKDKKNITKLAGVEWTYHSYDDQLYFISDRDTCHRCFYLYKTDWRGTDPKKISEVRLADSWMSSRKNGSEMIVLPHKTVDTVFYVLDNHGKVIQKLNTGLPYSADPLFVNKGTQVVFRGAHKKFKKDNGYIDELFIINSDGTGLKQLTHYPKEDTTSQWYNYHAGPPKLHPHNNFISYQSFQNGKYSLYGVSLEGKEMGRLTTNMEDEGWHDWSPDGKWLAIEIFDNDQSQFHIGLLNWKSKEMKLLTDTTYKYQQSPNFILKK